MSNLFSSTASKLRTPNGSVIEDNLPGQYLSVLSALDYMRLQTSNTTGSFIQLQPDVNKIIQGFNGLATGGLGVTTIFAENTITSQTTSGTTIATYTPGSAGNFEITADYLITAITSGGAEIQVSWTDEGGTARTATLLLASLSGTTGTGATTTGPFSAIPYRLRSSANNAITVKTAGTFAATYDASAAIKQTG